MPPLVSVVIPSHNRPHFLRESIESVIKQSYPHCEIVVVDDGSHPPVDRNVAQSEFGTRIKLVRNETPLGIARVRDQGVREARGEFVLHLDDDDLLAPETIETGLVILKKYPSVDLVFLGVKGFGQRADYFNKVQRKGVDKVVKIGRGWKVEPGVVKFEKELFCALLETVPSAFQHWMMKKPVWNSVSALRFKAYRIDHQISDEETAWQYIADPRNECEWALYAASICRTLLVDRPLYIARCNGQGNFSIPSQARSQLEASINIKRHLYSASCEIDELLKWRHILLENLTNTYFGAAYYYFHNLNRWTSWSILTKAIRLKASFRHFRFFARTLLPRKLNRIAGNWFQS